MNIIMCVDDGGGVMFNHRRQSQDRALRGRVAQMSSGARLLMSPYTARQFRRDYLENLAVSEDFLDKAQDGDYCFVEGQDPRSYEDVVERLIIYRWNRDYPRDMLLPFDLTQWRLVQSTDFEGSSHENITEEVYVRGDAPEQARSAVQAAGGGEPVELEEAAASCIRDET